MALSGGTRYRVLYDYEATNADELTIVTGQIVYVTEELDKGWVRGYLHDKLGMFPAAYVELDSVAHHAPSSGPPISALPPIPSAAKLSPTLEAAVASAETAQVIDDFSTKDPAQLALKKGELVIILRKFPTGWASGESQGKTGMFPLTNVRILDLAEAAALRPQTASPTISTAAASKKAANKDKRISRIRPTALSSTNKNVDDEDDEEVKGGTPATVMFDYTAADKGQLSLLSGETVYVLDKLSGGWWKGRTDEGDVGFFPGSYVRENPAGSGSPAPANGKDTSGSISPGGGGSSVSLAVTNSTTGTNLKKASTVAPKSLKKATVIYKYIAKTPNELSLEVGDEVLVFPVKEGEAGGWWTGALASAPTVVAHFPASYVRMVGPEDDSKLGSDLKLLKDQEKKDKRKSQPAKTTNSGTLSRNKPPPAKVPARPGDANDDSSFAASTQPVLTPVNLTPRIDQSSDSAGESPGSGFSRSATSVNGSNSDIIEGLTKSTELATKTSEQTKQGLVKLQQQSKTVFEGMLQRLDAADKDRHRLEHAMREMHKMLQASEQQRTKLEAQNKAIYGQVTELKTQLAKESSARSSLEARLARLEQHR